MNAITAPGIYDLTHEAYHADPCDVPSLSSSVAKILVRQTPAHAWQAHARMGNIRFEPSRVMDDGSAMHAMILGQSELIYPLRTVYGPKTKRKELIGLPVADYKSDAAQEERDEIRGIGRIPVLQSRLPELIRCRTAAMRQIAEADDGAGFFADGRNEVCVVSIDDDVMLRCLVDRLPTDPSLPPYDLKCTELSAAPGGWERRLQHEYAFQDAFYRRVIRGARGVEPEPMRFIVVELNPPHGTVIMSAAPALRAVAEAEVERAIQRWRHCVRTDAWPCYPPQTTWIEASPWQITQSMDTTAREQEGAPATFSAIKYATKGLESCR
jgi:hypothetical protein